MNRIIRVSLPLITVVGFGCASAGNAAEDATCKQVFDAMAKSIVTPSHSYVTLKIDALKGGPETSEMINTGKASFLKSGGKWKAGVSPQAMLDQMNENRKDTKSMCHFVRDEAIDGVSASLFAIREDDGDGSGAIDSQVWLAKANGLPVHIKLDMDGTHSETRYVYGDVSAPPLN